MVEDVSLEVAMAPRVPPDYATWWIAMHPSSLTLDELDSRSDDVVSLPSKEDDHMNVDNLIHDSPPLVGGLEVIVAVAPSLGKKDSSHNAS